MAKQEGNVAGGRNFSIPLPGTTGKSDSSGELLSSDNELVRQIAEAEQSGQWTLMHRFNRAADLLEQALSVRPIPYAEPCLISLRTYYACFAQRHVQKRLLWTPGRVSSYQ